MHGFLLGNALLGESGKPLPKGERKEKRKLAADRGDADYSAQKRRKIQHERRLIDRFQDKPAIEYGKDDIISHNVPGVSDKYEKAGCLRLQHGPEHVFRFGDAPDPNAGKPREVTPNRRTKYKRASDRLAPVIVRIG